MTHAYANPIELAQDGHAAAEHDHVVPFSVLFWTFAFLIVMTVITVTAAGVPAFKPFAIWVAMAVAVFKAMAVMLWFMHLRYDTGFNSIAIVCAILFVFLFIFMCYLDTAEYRADVDPLAKPMGKLNRGT